MTSYKAAAGAVLLAMRLKLTPSFEPYNTKLAGLRSNASSAVKRVSPCTTRLVKVGNTVKPVFNLSRFRYLVDAVPSIALAACWASGEFAEVAVTGSPGTARLKNKLL